MGLVIFIIHYFQRVSMLFISFKKQINISADMSNRFQTIRANILNTVMQYFDVFLLVLYLYIL